MTYRRLSNQANAALHICAKQHLNGGNFQEQEKNKIAARANTVFMMVMRRHCRLVTALQRQHSAAEIQELRGFINVSGDFSAERG
jgi:hypothetical protein